ncbi:unnamed protein product [Notodromas monacha]|uniref:Uncharacterized protein n=1 Tax=Notodromas monacha TaxID=399045 RepID=A0A7R9BR59_9CRUS|nr:unnamed protein product [Notodromas monacha]CAG0919291.1 unnamed protein product [Notodromas monacha]
MMSVTVEQIHSSSNKPGAFRVKDSGAGVVQIALGVAALSSLAIADKKPESGENSDRVQRDNIGLGYGSPIGYGAQERDSYGPPAPSYGGHGGHGGHGHHGGGYGGGFSSSSGGGYTHYAKPAVIRIPVKIPIPITVPKHSHHHHYHKHIRVTPVNHHHKHVKVYPLYQQHRHVKVVPHVTKVIKVQKPILVKPIVTPIYKPVVHEYKTVEHKSYDGGEYQGKVSHSHSDGGSYSGGVHRQNFDDGVRHINKGVVHIGGYGAPQVKTLPAIVNQGYNAAPSYAAPAVSPAPGYGAPAPDTGYGAPSGGYSRSDSQEAAPASGGSYGH